MCGSAEEKHLEFRHLTAGERSKNVRGMLANLRNPERRTASRDRYERILNELRERMILHEYPPGTRLGEEDLAEEFSVSRTPMHRVLSRLAFEGFIEVRQGSGTYVTEVNWEELVDAYELRMRLAELIGELNPQQVTPESIDRARDIRDRVKTRGYGLTPKEYRKLNGELQDEVNLCIGNRQLLEVVQRLYFITQRDWFGYIGEMNWRKEIDNFHWQIDDTIRCMEINDVRGIGLVWRNVISAMVRNLSEYRLVSLRAGPPAEYIENKRE